MGSQIPIGRDGVVKGCGNDGRCMGRTRIIAVLILMSFFIGYFSVLSDGASATTWSPSITVHSGAGVKWIDGDIARGVNYLYSFSDQYTSTSIVNVKRSTDGVIWTSPTSVWSGLNSPRGGFCVYTVGGTDNIICSAFENVKKSSDNGASFSSLTPLSAQLDYTGVATNASMDPSRAYDGDIYITGNLYTQGIGVFLTKSVDDGTSWSPMYEISVNSQTPPESCMCVLMRNESKLFCIYGEGAYWTQGIPRDVYVRNSTDWGKTWGGATKIFSHTQLSAYPGNGQYLDDQRCLLTIVDHASDSLIGRGIYGYLWYSNNTFQTVGYETGADYNNPDAHSYVGMIRNEMRGVNYTSLYCNNLGNGDWIIKTHHTYDSGISISGINMTMIEPPAPQPAAEDAPTDSDLDGLSDNEESLNGTDPYNWDTDGDILSDGFEVRVSDTDPNNNDTDADGVDDFTDFIQKNGYSGQIRTLPSGWVEMTITWQNKTIVVQTNSSVLEGKFDKENAKLTVKVHGPSGTIGAADILVPKTMCNLSDIKVQFDGGAIDYNVSVDSSCYKIHLTYHHSEHELSAQFLEGGEEGSAEESAPVYLIVIMTAIVSVAIGATAVAIVHRKKNYGGR